MKPKFKWLLLITLLVSPYTQANAGFWAEPYLGYSLGTYSQNVIAQSSNIGGQVDGLKGGARLGMSFGPAGLVLVGIDISYGLLNLNIDQGTTFRGQFNNFNLGLVAGVDIPVAPIRAWIGYLFLDTVNGNQTGTTGSNYDLAGFGLKAGVGYSPIPLLSINVEFIAHQYWSHTDANGTQSNFPASTPLSGNASGDNIQNNAFFFSVSAPINIPF